MGVRFTAPFLLISWWIILISATFAFQSSTYFQGGLNESCTRDSDCTVRNSYCQETFPTGEETCRCYPDYLDYVSGPENCPDPGPPQPKVVSCLPVANNLSDKCGVDLQCTSGLLGELSHCSDGICQCIPGGTYSELTNSCVALAKKLNDPCELGHVGCQCKNIPFATCSAGVCRCGEGSVESHVTPGTCLLAAEKVGDSCERDNIICSKLPNAICQPVTKTCECVNDAFGKNEDETACIPKVTQLGDSCKETVQCNVANSWCPPDTNLCQCKPGFVQAAKQANTCLIIRTYELVPCDEDIQCTSGLGEYAHCDAVSAKCSCNDNAILHSHRCYPTASLAEPCTFSEQCLANSTVLPGGFALTCQLDHTVLNDKIQVCRCPSDTHSEFHGRCYQNTGFRVSCSSTEQCRASLGGSELVTCNSSTNTCECTSQYMESRDGRRCILETVGLGESCEESTQCSETNGNSNQYCDYSTGTCKCLNGDSGDRNSCG